MNELEREIRAQQLDDTRLQRPQEFGGARTAPAHAADAWTAYEEPGFAAVEDQLADEPHIETESEARARITREVVASLSAFERRVFELTYGGGYVKSSREVASDMDGAVSYKTVQRAQDAIADAVRAALAAASEVTE